MEPVSPGKLVPELFEANCRAGLALLPEKGDHFAKGGDGRLIGVGWLRGLFKTVDEGADGGREAERVRPAFHHECAELPGSVKSKPTPLTGKAGNVEAALGELTFQPIEVGGGGDGHGRPADSQGGGQPLGDLGDEEVVVRVKVCRVGLTLEGGTACAVVEARERVRLRSVLHRIVGSDAEGKSIKIPILGVSCVLLDGIAGGSRCPAFQSFFS